MRLLLIGLLLIFHLDGYAQWTMTNGPYGKTRIDNLYQHQGTLIAATGCGIFSRVGLQQNWKLRSPIDFSTAAIIADTLLLATWNDGIGRIILTETEWVVEPVNPLNLTELHYAAPNLYGGNVENGFMVSTDYGNAWSSHNDGLPTDTINWMSSTWYETHISVIYTANGYIFCGTDYGVYRTDENLAPWTEVNSGMIPGTVSTIKLFEDTLYAAIDSTLYFSTTNGDYWTLAFNAPSSIRTVHKANGTSYVGTEEHGVYKSLGATTSWTVHSTGLSDSTINVIDSYMDTVICGTLNDGFFHSNNQEWFQNIPYMICSDIRELTSTDNTLISNSLYDIFYLEDQQWAKMNIPEIIAIPNLSSGIGSVVTMGDTMIHSYYYTEAGWPYYHSFIDYTTDLGLSWNSMLSLNEYETDGAFKLHIGNNKVYRWYGQSMFFSEDFGQTWENISLPNQYCNSFTDFTIYENIPLALACGDGEFLALDESLNWMPLNSGLPTDRPVSNIAFCDSAIFANVLVHGMYVTRDAGSTWNPLGTNLFDEDYIQDFTFKDSLVFIATGHNGIYASSDYGEYWTNINDDLPSFSTSALTIFKDTLYIGTSKNGVWKRSLNDIPLSIEHPRNNTNSIDIYPNPATNQIIIKTPWANQMHLEFFDFLGRKIHSTTTESEKTVVLPNLIPGPYIVQITNEQFSSFERLLIIK